MQSLDEKVIGQLRRWLQQDQVVWLCTVIASWGSAPRIPGSLMVCNRAGEVVGSLSGGCVEEDLVEQLQQGLLAADSAAYKIYGASEADIERFNLPCGGTLGVLIEPMTTGQLPMIEAIEKALARRENVRRQCQWQPGASLPSMQVTVCQQRGALSFECDEQGLPQSLSQVYGPISQLIIIGVTEVTQALAQFALAADFRVTVVDPRPEMAAQWAGQWKEQSNANHSEYTAPLITGMPDDVIAELAVDANTAIVAVTHDPRIDDMGLMDAFNTPAFYIGAMGSSKTSAKRRERLTLLGVDEAQLQRLHAPIGLDIRSKTPVEIAIAIIAELVLERARHCRPVIANG